MVDDVKGIARNRGIEIGFTQPSDADCLVIMGVPIGNDKAVCEHLFKKTDECLKMSRQCALHLGLSPHELLHTLRKCFATKMNHFARCVRSELVYPVLLYCDIALCEIFLGSVGLTRTCMYNLDSNVVQTLPGLDVMRDSLMENAQLPDGVSVNWRGLELMLSARYGGFEVSTCSTLAVAQRIGMFVNICKLKSSPIAAFFRSLIHPFLNHPFRLVDDVHPCRQFYPPSGVNNNVDNVRRVMPDIPHFFEDVVHSFHHLNMRLKVRDGGEIEIEVVDDPVNEVDWYVCTIEWLLPSDGNGARILYPNKASRVVSDIARKCIQSVVMYDPSIPECAALSLRESSERGARDVLLSHPSWSSCLSPACISILARLKLVCMQGLANKCNRCDKDGAIGVRHVEHCGSNCVRGFRTNRHQCIVMALEKELRSHPYWTIMRNDRAVVYNADSHVGERVSDVTIVGEYLASIRSVQLDVSTVNVHCPSICNVRNPYTPCDGDLDDPMVHVQKREREKKIQYAADWSRRGDLFIPVCMSAYGAMSSELIGNIRQWACEILGSEDGNNGHGDWVVPTDHILMSLRAQRIRTNLAAAAVRASCWSFAKLIGFN